MPVRCIIRGDQPHAQDDLRLNGRTWHHTGAIGSLSPPASVVHPERPEQFLHQDRMVAESFSHQSTQIRPTFTWQTHPYPLHYLDTLLTGLRTVGFSRQSLWIYDRIR